VNLQQLRDYIRAQLDMDEEELPNGLLDSYLWEGYLRTISLERRWPFFETYFDVAATADDAAVAIPVECDGQQIASMFNSDTGQSLIQIGNELAEAKFVGGMQSSTPTHFSVWGNKIYLWPWPADGAEVHLKLRGFRKPLNWVASGSSAEVDADERLHILLAHYAIALCYAQQEDEVLEDVYMKRWQASFAIARTAICAPRHNRPLVFNVGLTPGQASGNTVTWNLPSA